jgi:hypothetical protein
MTAVEWVKDAYLNDFDGTNLDELFDKAKEMEKQQIINAMDVTQRTDFYVKYEGSEDYYNKTFKTKQE